MSEREQLTDEQCDEIAQRAYLEIIDWVPVPRHQDRALIRAGARAALSAQPVAWRWRAKGSKIWIYDPDRNWLDAQGDVIEKQPLYAAPPALSAQPPREPTPEMIEAAFRGVIEDQSVPLQRERRERMAANWRAMWDAAPPAQEPQRSTDGARLAGSESEQGNPSRTTSVAGTQKANAAVASPPAPSTHQEPPASRQEDARAMREDIAKAIVSEMLLEDEDWPLIFDAMEPLAARLAQAERERDRWREDSMRQAATINRMAQAAEDRNEVDQTRAKHHLADMSTLRAENERMRKALEAADAMARYFKPPRSPELMLLTNRYDAARAEADGGR